MRRLLPKFSLQKCFLLTLGFAILVIFGFSIREKDFWKSRDNQSQQFNNINQHRKLRIAPKPTIPSTIQSPQQQLELKPTYDTYDDLNSQILKNSKNNNNNNNNNDHEFSLTSAEKWPSKNIDINGGDAGDTADGGGGGGGGAGSGGNGSNRSNGRDDITDYSNNSQLRPWYFSDGKRCPVEAKTSHKTKRRLAKLHPDEDQQSDRITNQLMFIPTNYEKYQEAGKFKTILLFNGLGPWNVKNGRDVFLNSKCPVNTCKITANRDAATTADLVLYKDHYIPTGIMRPAKQLFMLYLLECPYHTQHIKFPDAFNWTATYRKDSDIVTPYEKWEYFNPNIKEMDQERNFALNKTKKVAWFVSNCGARNGRLQYAHELGKHIQVDIYGSCGAYKCSRSIADKCFEILDHDYKFYLAFENSNCKDYITEKFFVNALSRNILPIVMGARPEDYERAAPYRSYIHVDEFSSAKELAGYLNILDENDELYNSYFKWKGTGEFINTYFWCRVCSMLHDDQVLDKPKWYEDINDWWRGPGVCTNGSWRNYQARKDVINDDD